MSDLIDREQAKDAIDKYLVGRNLVTDGTFMARLINEIVIDRLPSAQPTFDARDTQYNLPIGTDMIDRQKAIDALRKKQDNGKGDISRFYNTIIQHDIEAIMALPSAHPDTYWKEQCQSYEQTINKLRESLSTQPEIVKCKNCKHWIPYDWMFSEVWQSKNIADYPEDDIGCDCSEMAMKANDFCSRAERRTE